MIPVRVKNLEMSKAKALPVGSIRDWKGQKMQKQGDGSWKPVAQGQQPVAAPSQPVTKPIPAAQVFPDPKTAKAGDRVKVGDFWYELDAAGKWSYAGVASSKVMTPAQQAQAVKQSDKKIELLQKVAAGTAERLRQATTKRDRIVEGQSVQYNGGMHGKYRGKVGKLVAMGKGGSAVVRMQDGEVLYCRWSSLKPVGSVQPHSLYDGLRDDQMYYVKGSVREALDKAMNSTIGKSGITYKELVQKFKDAGFNLLIVGGTVRDFLQGKDTKDIDFIVNCTDNELKNIVTMINPKWSTSWKLNDKLGLVTIIDGDENVDITPIHLHVPGLDNGGMAKGWRLKSDAESRDLTMNSLHLDPTTGLMVDATGRGLKCIDDQKIDFCDPHVLKENPRYVLRTFKFLGRGYKITPDAEKAIQDNLTYTKYLPFDAKKRFLENQIVGKDGVPGLKAFKENFLKYDKAGVWQSFEPAYQAMLNELGVK